VSRDQHRFNVTAFHMRPHEVVLILELISYLRFYFILYVLPPGPPDLQYTVCTCVL
jgi:hypothetical protein